MCLEDLRLGRGRYTSVPVVINSTTDSILTPNFNRVGILWSMFGFWSWDQAGTQVMLDYAAIIPHSTFSGGSVAAYLFPGSSTLFMGVEQYGQLVTGPWSVRCNNTSGVMGISITEILTEVNAPPINTYKP